MARPSLTPERWIVVAQVKALRLLGLDYREITALLDLPNPGTTHRLGRRPIGVRHPRIDPDPGQKRAMYANKGQPRRTAANPYGTAIS